MTGFEILATAIAVLAFYSWVCNRATALLHPTRMEIVALGDKMLDDTRVSEEVSNRISATMDSAYSTGLGWVFTLSMPFAAVAAIYDAARGRPDPVSDVPADLTEDYRRFMRLSFFSIVGNSPLASLICSIEVLILAAFVAPLGRILREAVLLPGKFDSRSHNGNHKFGH